MNFNNLTWFQWKETFIKYSWLLIIGLIISGTGSYIYAKYIATPTYTSSFEVLLNTKASQENEQQGLKDDIPLITTYLSVLKSDDILQKLAADLKTGDTANTLAKQTTVESIDNSLVFKISFSDESKEKTAAVSQLFVKHIQTEFPAIFPKINVVITKQPETITQNLNKSRLILALLLPVLLYFSLTLLLCVIDTHVQSKEQIEALNLPYLGDFPTLKKNQRIEWSKRHQIL
jgi:capsular polysaccharide biosynthesis protein